jgi:hypothetical protein
VTEAYRRYLEIDARVQARYREIVAGAEESEEDLADQVQLASLWDQMSDDEQQTEDAKGPHSYP